MKHLVTFAVGLALGVPALAAQPVSPHPQWPGTVDRDLRCMAVYALLADRLPSENKAGIAAGMMYYVGRIDAVVADFPYEEELLALLASKQFEVGFGEEAKRCGAEMVVRGKAVEGLGQALTAKGH